MPFFALANEIRWQNDLMNTYSGMIKAVIYRNVPKGVLLLFINVALEVECAAANKVIDL